MARSARSRTAKQHHPLRHTNFARNGCNASASSHKSGSSNRIQSPPRGPQSFALVRSGRSDRLPWVAVLLYFQGTSLEKIGDRPPIELIAGKFDHWDVTLSVPSS